TVPRLSTSSWARGLNVVMRVIIASAPRPCPRARRAVRMEGIRRMLGLQLQRNMLKPVAMTEKPAQILEHPLTFLRIGDDDVTAHGLHPRGQGPDMEIVDARHIRHRPH